jgi:cytochrome c oxidase subunit 2
MRSQDVLHSAYMPHFRAQMNCVPGMVTQFAFTPSMTTEEMRESPEMVEKVFNINKIRNKKSAENVLEGKPTLDPYTFDFLLLCNKICGASHYNMQMKIIVDTPEDYKKWLKEKQTVVASVKAAAEEPETDENAVGKDSSSTKVDSAKVASK